MSLKYDAMRHPDVQQWLAHSEAERIEAVEAYHRNHRLKVPNLHLHATLQVVVENQIAPLLRLIREGLDRHDAVHAIGSVLASDVYDILKTSEARADPNAAYYSELHQLTAASWRASGSR